MQPSYNEFEKLYGKYENLHQKFTEARRELVYREGEINRLKTLLNNKKYENGKDSSINITENECNLITDQALFNDDNYVFNKKIKCIY